MLHTERREARERERECECECGLVWERCEQIDRLKNDGLGALGLGRSARDDSSSGGRRACARWSSASVTFLAVGPEEAGCSA